MTTVEPHSVLGRVGLAGQGRAPRRQLCLVPTPSRPHNPPRAQIYEATLAEKL